jgi:hypothetical protein
MVLTLPSAASTEPGLQVPRTSVTPEVNQKVAAGDVTEL